MTGVREIVVMDHDVAVMAALWGFYAGFLLIVVAVGLLMMRVNRLEKRMSKRESPDAGQ